MKSLVYLLFQYVPTGLSGAIPLFGAARFVGNRHFDQTHFQEWVKNLVSELGAIGATASSHQLGD
jgi:hypothetical protein